MVYVLPLKSISISLFMGVCGNLIVFSQFDRRSVYPFPIGAEDKKQALDAIIADSEERGIPCRITGMSPEARELLESLYPSRFSFHCDEGSFDYVYNIDDLADLKGKKYHGKRNHIYRFEEEHPGCVAIFQIRHFVSNGCAGQSQIQIFGYMS